MAVFRTRAIHGLTQDLCQFMFTGSPNPNPCPHPTPHTPHPTPLLKLGNCPSPNPNKERRLGRGCDRRDPYCLMRVAIILSGLTVASRSPRANASRWNSRRTYLRRASGSNLSNGMRRCIWIQRCNGLVLGGCPISAGANFGVVKATLAPGGAV